MRTSLTVGILYVAVSTAISLGTTIINNVTYVNNTYVNRETAFWFNTPESWRVPNMVARPSNPEQYQRPRAVWELLFAIYDPYKK